MTALLIPLTLKDSWKNLSGLFDPISGLLSLIALGLILFYWGKLLWGKLRGGGGQMGGRDGGLKQALIATLIAALLLVPTDAGGWIASLADSVLSAIGTALGKIFK